MTLACLIRSFLAVLLVGLGLSAQAAPGKVVVGTYVNKMTGVSFKDSQFSLDFYIWFRWKPEGELADYKPLESMELINGRIENKSSVVEKKIGDLSYASARVTATIFKNWELESFPFDHHLVQVHLEDSQFVDSALVFEPDVANSRLGDEIALPGWNLSDFSITVAPKSYKSNYGDTSLPTDALSTYSRMSFGLDMAREGVGTAVKLLGTVVFATLMSFVVFGIRPVDVDPRFGLGAGALFAVAASAFVVASSLPDSARLTIADKIHVLAMAFIFGSVVQSAFALKWDEAGEEAKWKTADKWSLILFPTAFIIGAAYLVRSSLN